MVSPRYRLQAVALCLLAVLLGPLGGCTGARPVEQDAGTERIEQANRYLQIGWTDSAWASFGLALEKNPKLVEGYVGMGRIWHEWKNYPLAHRAYETATILDPSHFEAQHGLGLSKQMLGRVQDAVLIYLRALALNPNSFEANHHLAGAYLLLDRPEEAVPYALRATKLKPAHQGAWTNLALAYTNSGHHEKALDAYRHAVELGEGPPDAPILMGFANAHIQLGNFDRAILVLRNQIRRQPTAVAYERTGYCLFKRKRLDDALVNFRAALSIDGEDTAALNGLGACLMTMYLRSDGKHPNQRREALSAWHRSIELRPDQPRIEALIRRYEAMEF